MQLFRVARTWYVKANTPQGAIEAAKPGEHVDVAAESTLQHPFLRERERKMEEGEKDGD